MIVVIEGAIGAGKTSLGRALNSMMNAPLYRPFRLQRDDHTPGIGDPRVALVESAMPVNTYLEDMYVADLLAALRDPVVILDRSLPSGLAYNQAGAHGLPTEQLQILASLWAERMVQAHALVIYMDAPRDRCRKIAGTRYWEREAQLIHGVLDWMWRSVDGFRDILYRVHNDDSIDIEALASEIVGDSQPSLLTKTSWR